MPTELMPDSTLYWTAAAVTAAIDVVFLGLLMWRIDRAAFGRLQPSFLLVSLLFWGGLYGWAFNAFWDECYAFVLPGWARWAALPYGVASGALGSAFWWLSLRLPGHPLPWFALLGGLHSVPGHAHAIYGRSLLDGCPILADVSPASALVFGAFEFMLYWLAVLALAAVVRWLRPGKVTAEAFTG